MKKCLKIFGYVFLSIAVLLYAGFLFILPNVINLEEYKPAVQKLAAEKTGLNIDFKNIKLVTTPFLAAGIKADDISIKLPDESVLFSANSLQTRISLPSIFLLTVKVSCLDVDSPFINLEIINDDNFKVVKLIENMLNEGKEQLLEENGQTTEEDSEKFKFNPNWIRIKVPNARLYNYKILVNDLKTKHFLKLGGEKLTLGYFNGKTAKLKTYAELYSDENKNVTANIDVNTFLPPFGTKLDKEDDPAERIDIPFVNPVTMYRNYDLKADLDTKLRVRKSKGRISSFGHFNIENLTLKVSDLVLPKSYLRAKTFGTTVTLDTSIYPVKEQYIRLLGKLNYGKRPRTDMYIKTSIIKFNDMLLLTKAVLDSLHIKNELAQIKAEGFLTADCYIKTNFKKWNSNGSLTVKDAGVSVRNLGRVLSEGNINAKLENNTLGIENSSILIGSSPLYINGKIDEKSVADIKIKAEKIPLPSLFNAFAPEALRHKYNFKSGDASFNFGLAGELKKILAVLNFSVDNLNISDSSVNVTNEKLSGELRINSKEQSGQIDNRNLVVFIPKTKSKISVPDLDVEAAGNNLIIKENSILLNDKTNLKFGGSITDYNQLETINLFVQGDVSTDDLIKFAGSEYKPFIHSQGTIPFKLTLDGNKQKQTLFVQALSDKDNFITPVDIAGITGRNVSLQSVIDFKPNRIKIKKTGIFKRTVTVDEKGNEIINLDEVLGIDGTVAGNRINLMKITIPETLKGTIYAFPQSVFELGGRVYVFGESAAPRLRGGFEISNLSIPELLLAFGKCKLDFKGHSADVALKNLDLNGSDIQLESKISLLPSKIINILNLDVNSKYFNLDKVLKVSELAMNYVPKNTSSAPASSKQADIPAEIKGGNINFNHIVTGNINVRNTAAQISMAKNVFFVRNLRTNVFDGIVRGDISVNLLSTLLNIKVRGNGVDVEKALLDSAGMKDTLSGTAAFDTDISLQGSTYEEQMKSLKGRVNFVVTDGQFGPFGKLENLIIAENIRESQLFQTALGGIISGLTTIDTTHFSELKGTLNFNDGIVNIAPITSLGNILSLYISGDFDILQNHADMTVRARMASLVSNLLGPLSAINPANLINSAASLNIVTAKAFSIFCVMLPEEEINAIPSFANEYVDNAATKFQLEVRGDAAKPLTLVKSFKWLATANEIQQATDYVNSIPEPVEGSEAETIGEVIQEVEAEQKTLKYKIKQLFKKEEHKENIEE